MLLYNHYIVIIQSFYKINIFVRYNVTEHHDESLDTRW